MDGWLFEVIGLRRFSRSLLTAAWAGARGQDGRQRCAFPVGDLVKSVNNNKDIRDDDAIIDIPTLTAVGKQAGIAQHHKLLRKVRLPPAEESLQVTDASFSIAQRFEDRQPRRVSQCL